MRDQDKYDFWIKNIARSRKSWKEEKRDLVTYSFISFPYLFLALSNYHPAKHTHAHLYYYTIITKPWELVFYVEFVGFATCIKIVHKV